MSTAAVPRAAVRPLVRVDDGALVGGVAAGIAAHVHRRVRDVRLGFVALSLFGGFGAVLYAAYWIVLPGAPRTDRVPRRRRAAQVVVAAVVAGAVLSVAWSSSLLLPAVLACVGGAFLWRRADDVTRRSWGERSVSVVTAPLGDRAGRVRLAAGALLIALAVVAVLARIDVRSLGDTLVAVLVATVGLALLTGPWWMRLVRELGDERRERIRSEERAELAARVHDSVLQTLALIQRRADSPREVARLARGQERALRALLWGDPTPASSVVAGLRAVAAEVEDGYGIAVDVVAVGDAPSGPAADAVVAAAREALVNAAKHAGVAQVSLYAEVDGRDVLVYVRDRGRGFDPEAVAADRQGLRRSVVERLARHGGTATVHSAPERGTEVELHAEVP